MQACPLWSGIPRTHEASQGREVQHGWLAPSLHCTPFSQLCSVCCVQDMGTWFLLMAQAADALAAVPPLYYSGYLGKLLRVALLSAGMVVYGMQEHTWEVAIHMLAERTFQNHQTQLLSFLLVLTSADFNLPLNAPSPSCGCSLLPPTLRPRQR